MNCREMLARVRTMTEIRRVFMVIKQLKDSLQNCVADALMALLALLLGAVAGVLGLAAARSEQSMLFKVKMNQKLLLSFKLRSSRHF